jgi:hypothetical protein
LIPLALREAGALASFTDDALAMAPFASTGAGRR